MPSSQSQSQCKMYKLPVVGAHPSVELSKFKPRAPTHMAALNAQRLGPNNLAFKRPFGKVTALPFRLLVEEGDAPRVGEAYTSYRSMPLPLRQVGGDRVQVAMLEKFGSLCLNPAKKEDPPKSFAVFAATYTLEKGGEVAYALVGVNEYMLSNQCLARFTVGKHVFHSVEQLFQAMKVVKIAELAGAADAEWVKKALAALCAAPSPRHCQIATGGKGGLIPAEVFAKTEVQAGWHAMGAEVLTQTLLHAAMGSDEFHGRWRSLMDAMTVELGDNVRFEFAEMREDKATKAEVWGSGVLLSQELEDAMFDAAVVVAAAATDELFTPQAFVHGLGGEAGNHFGKGVTAFATIVAAEKDATHADFCERARALLTFGLEEAEE